jgi:hypothetical protein
MKSILIVALTLAACSGDIGRKKSESNEQVDTVDEDTIKKDEDPKPDPTPVPQPTPTPLPEPTPTPTPTPPPPSPEEIAIAGFFTNSQGRWLGNCAQLKNQDSWKGGIEIKRKTVTFLSLYFPQTNIDCSGTPASKPNDEPKITDIEFIKPDKDGWFAMKVNCRDNKHPDRCNVSKMMMMKVVNNVLTTRELKNDPNQDQWNTYSNGRTQ